MAKKRSLPGSVWKIIAISCVSALIGARLLHIFTNIGLYTANPSRAWAIDTLGFSMFGGLVCGAIAAIVACRIMRINFWRLGDSLAPPLGLGIAVMRIGCYLNGCCFGHETRLPWGVSFPILSPAHKYQLAKSTTDFFHVTPVHPTEIYEMIAALIGAGLSAYLIKKKASDGAAILSFLLFFSLFRWFNYYLRATPPTFDASPLLYPSIYLTVAIACAVLLFRRTAKDAKSA